MTETRRCSAKELARVVDQDRQLSEEPLLKQIVSNQVEGRVFGFECFRV